MARNDDDRTASDRVTSGRTRRAMKVGGLTTQVGGNYLLSALRRTFRSAEKGEQDLLETHLKNARLLVERSQEMRGAFLKLTQMLSMRGDLLPAEMLEVLSVVQSEVPPMSLTAISAQIERELGASPEDLFEHFEPEAFAAASLGQVHRARLPDGEEVIVKVQYPGVEETVTQDLDNVRTLLQIVSRITRDLLPQKIDIEEVYGELEQRLSEELDYEREASNARRFAEMFADDEEVVIPRVFSKFTSRRVLTAEYIEGYKFSDMLGPGVDQELKDQIAIKYFRTFWRQVFEFGTLHTDPHPGNYLVTFHPHLVILDFGSIRTFPDEVRRAYLRLARGLIHPHRQGAAAAITDLRFADDPEDAMAMVRVLDVIFEPTYSDRPFDPRDYDTVERAMEATTVQLENRSIRSPDHSIFLGRALVGLDAYLQQFGSVLNYHRLLDECIRDAEEKEKG
jgi:predicted unusual protein kinase regulating ubiquinone biosynthesis (AarF/ABC1/UbiB family)